MSTARYYLKLRNLVKNSHLGLLKSHIALPSLISTLKFLPGTTKRDIVAEVSSLSKEEIIAVGNALKKNDNWQWNRGFRAHVLAYISRNGTTNYMQRLTGFSPRPEFIGENINDVLPDFRPGVMVRFPSYEQRAKGVEMDQRLRDNHAWYGQPVIIVHNHDDNLVNVVLCSDLNQGSVSNLLSSIKNEQIERSVAKRLMEVVSNNTTVLDENVSERFPLLELEGGVKLDASRRMYVELTVYTVALQSLARLDSMIKPNQYQTKSKGYVRLAEFHQLASQMKRCNIDATEKFPTELRGVDLARLTYNERMVVIKRMKQDAANVRKGHQEALHRKLHLAITAERKALKLPPSHPSAIVRNYFNITMPGVRSAFKKTRAVSVVDSLHLKLRETKTLSPQDVTKELHKLVGNDSIDFETRRQIINAKYRDVRKMNAEQRLSPQEEAIAKEKKEKKNRSLPLPLGKGVYRQQYLKRDRPNSGNSELGRSTGNAIWQRKSPASSNSRIQTSDNFKNADQARNQKEETQGLTKAFKPLVDVSQWSTKTEGR